MRKSVLAAMAATGMIASGCMAGGATTTTDAIVYACTYNTQSLRVTIRDNGGTIRLHTGAQGRLTLVNATTVRADVGGGVIYVVALEEDYLTIGGTRYDAQCIREG